MLVLVESMVVHCTLIHLLVSIYQRERGGEGESKGRRKIRMREGDERRPRRRIKEHAIDSQNIDPFGCLNRGSPYRFVLGYQPAISMVRTEAY